MGRNVGIWLDYSECIVSFPDEGNYIRRIVSRAGRHRQTGVHPERNTTVSRDPHAMERMRKYFLEIIQCVHSASAIFLCGPDDAKSELLEMLPTEVRETVLAVETQKKLSTSDTVDFIHDRFNAEKQLMAAATDSK